MSLRSPAGPSAVFRFGRDDRTARPGGRPAPAETTRTEPSPRRQRLAGRVVRVLRTPLNTLRQDGAGRGGTDHPLRGRRDRRLHDPPRLEAGLTSSPPEFKPTGCRARVETSRQGTRRPLARQGSIASQEQGSSRAQVCRRRALPHPSRGEPRATRGELRGTRGDPRATRGEPRATRGDPRATRGEPRATRGEPRATRGEPRATRGEQNGARSVRSASRINICDGVPVWPRTWPRCGPNSRRATSAAGGFRSVLFQ